MIGWLTWGAAGVGVVLAGPNGGNVLGSPDVVPLYEDGALNKFAKVFGSGGPYK